MRELIKEDVAQGLGESLDRHLLKQPTIELDLSELMNQIKRHIVPCPRCQWGHRDLSLVPLSRPMILSDGLTYTHWATCRSTGDPILVMLAYNSIGDAIEYTI